MTRYDQVLHRLAPLSMVAAGAATIVALAPASPSPVQPDGAAVSTGVLLASSSAAATTGGPAVGQGPSPAAPSFGVTVGSLSGLYPGARGALPVTLHNPFRFPIKVVSYTATAAVPATSTRCPASNLVVPTGTVVLRNPRGLKPSGSNNLTVPVTLASKAPQACQRVAFSVTVSATAVPR